MNLGSRALGRITGAPSCRSREEVEHLDLKRRWVIARIAVDLPRGAGQRPVIGPAPRLDGGVGAGQLIGSPDVDRRRSLPGWRVREDDPVRLREGAADFDAEVDFPPRAGPHRAGGT